MKQVLETVKGQWRISRPSSTILIEASFKNLPDNLWTASIDFNGLHSLDLVYLFPFVDRWLTIYILFTDY